MIRNHSARLESRLHQDNKLGSHIVTMIFWQIQGMLHRATRASSPIINTNLCAMADKVLWKIWTPLPLPGILVNMLMLRPAPRTPVPAQDPKQPQGPPRLTRNNDPRDFNQALVRHWHVQGKIKPMITECR